jgi:ribonuclease HI
MLLFQQKIIPVIEVVEKASKTISEYQQHQVKNRTGVSNLTNSNELKWSPPPSNTLKTNVDAHCKGDGRWGLGWIVRNGDGVCLGAATRIVKAQSAVEAEAMGLEAALRSIHQFEGKPMVIEMDSSLIVKAIQSKIYLRAYWGSIVRSAGDLLAQCPNVSVCWGRRIGNKAAHLLARWAFNAPNPGWLPSVPPPHYYSYPN